MSTHNIYFRGEIRKISAFFGRKKRLICCYGLSRAPDYLKRDKQEPLPYLVDVQADLSLC